MPCLALLMGALLAQAVPAYRQAAHVAVIPIHGEIDQVTVASLGRRMELAASGGATAFVLELDTPGGDAMATLSMCHQLKGTYPANTVAWVRPQAYSAGTILALACREIVIVPGAAFGDAAPIVALPGMGVASLGATERAKAESPIIAEVVDSARQHGYDESLVQAFVRLGSELWLLESTDGASRVVVDAEEYKRVFGEEPPHAAVVLQPEELAPEDAPPLDPLVQAILGGRTRPDRPDRPDLELPPPAPEPPSRAALTQADRGRYRLLGQVVRPDTLLVVRGREALALGLARAEVPDEKALAAHFGASQVTRFEESWSEHAARFLMGWPARIVLVVAMLLFFFIEMAVPGTSWFGLGGMVCLGLLVGAPALVGAAEWWELVAILGGLLALLAEIFLLPGTGLLAVVGAILLFAGLVGLFTDASVATREGREEAVVSAGIVLGTFFASAVGMWLIGRHLPQARFMRRAVLGVGASTGEPSHPERPLPAPLPALGTVGVCRTPLRPTGRAEFGGRVVEVQSQMDFVEAGVRVRVVSIHDGLVEVEPDRG